MKTLSAVDTGVPTEYPWKEFSEKWRGMRRGRLGHVREQRTETALSVRANRACSTLESGGLGMCELSEQCLSVSSASSTSESIKEKLEDFVTPPLARRWVEIKIGQPKDSETFPIHGIFLSHL